MVVRKLPNGLLALGPLQVLHLQCEEGWSGREPADVVRLLGRWPLEGRQESVAGQAAPWAR
jgi:hypothetical protein